MVTGRARGRATRAAAPRLLRARIDRVKVATYARNRQHPGHPTAAFFLGFESGVCLFGVDETLFGEPDEAVGAMAHEVAHAFRSARDLVVADRDEEELLTDLTTVFLGFGVLSANAAYQYRSYLVMRASAYQHRKLGYLPFQALSYALAAHVLVRGEDLREVRRHLGPSQAESFEAALRALRKRPLLGGMLGVGRQQVRAPAAIAQLEQREAPPSPLLSEVAARHDELQPGQENRGRPVHGYFESSAMRYGLGAASLALFAAMPLVQRGRTGWAILLPIAAFLLARVIFRHSGSYRCTSCERVLPAAGEGTCPGCGGTVRGQVRNRADALDLDSDELPPSDLPEP